MPLPDQKKQPWCLFDSVVARSFLLGDTTADGLAVGSANPAITKKGELLFLSASGRNKANNPELTNLDVGGQMAYGLEMWGIYIMLGFPAMPPIQNTGHDPDLLPGVAGTIKLAECIVNYGLLTLIVGQEPQLEIPVERVGAGGGLHVTQNIANNIAQNSRPDSGNFLRLPEPIFFPRTQVLGAKISLDPIVHDMIGYPVPGKPGVGTKLDPYHYTYWDNPESIDPPPTEHDQVLDQLPFMVRVGLVGNRVREVQYGQLAPGQTA